MAYEPVLDAPSSQFEIIGGVQCPVDPMDRLQCDSCQ